MFEAGRLIIFRHRISLQVFIYAAAMQVRMRLSLVVSMRRNHMFILDDYDGSRYFKRADVVYIGWLNYL